MPVLVLTGLSEVHRLKGSGAIEGVWKVLLEEVFHSGWPLRFQILKSGAALSLCLVLVHLDTELSAVCPVPCLPVCCHASHHADNGINL